MEVVQARAAAVTLHLRALGDVTFVSVYGVSAAGWAGNSDFVEEVLKAAAGPQQRVILGGATGTWSRRNGGRKS
jgi:hypothetical protein